MFVRFVGATIDTDSGCHVGIFELSRALRAKGECDPWAEQRLLELKDWFDENLSRPDRFSRPGTRQALSWFRSSAELHLFKAWEIARVLETQGVIVEQLQQKRLDYIVYEDEYQVVSVPTRDERHTLGGKRS